MSIYYGGLDIIPTLKPGETLYLNAGTYLDTFPDVPNGKSLTSMVSICAPPGEVVVLQPNTSQILDFAGKSFIEFRDIVFDGSRISNSCIQLGPTSWNVSSGIVTNPTHNIRFRTCEIKNAKLQGIMVASECNDNEFLGCKIHHNGGIDNLSHGIYIESWRNLVQDCRIYNNAGHGVHVYNGYPMWHTQANIIRRNSCYNNGNGTNRNGAGIGIYSGPDNQVIENQCWANCVGIKLDYGAVNTVLKSNKAWDSRSNYQNNILIGTGAIGTIRYGNMVGAE